MEMKKTLVTYIGLVVLVLFSACETEDSLTPTNKDNNRVADFINSTDKELVQSVYHNFNCGLLYEYDPVMDFAYTAENADAVEKWGTIDLPMIREQFINAEGLMTTDSLIKYNAYVDQALNFVDTTIFKFFKADSYIGNKMPTKVILSNSIEAPTEIYIAELTESDSRTGEDAINALNCVFNNHSIVININQEAAKLNAEKFMKDNFYIFLCRIMEMHGLYDEIPEAFSALSSVYYGLKIEEVYAEEFGIDLEDDAEDAETVPDVIDKEWFYAKGFIDAKYFYNNNIGLTIIDGEPKSIKKQYSFVDDLDTDVRSFLNEMLHRNSDELIAFPEVIKSKMLVLLNTFEEWGVNIVAFNPDLAVIMD